ncbi:MAG: ABC transporter permease [Bacillota bacterium]|uniref:ABC transporter permease subunit n=1 Tax=Thermanaerosceptrum fracticalcis TaxID=1712410 RepID=A0A7G6E744_THEFR|nr:ABC transporter permease [Thermanaerosceptrum fracticalcis]QNB47898.1 ABC transporter permease subunit [Thermanaerosceptrum fracticalcis]
MIIYCLIKNELKMLWKDRVALISLFLLPCFFIWFFVQVFTPYLDNKRFSEKFQIALVNEDKTAYSKMLLSQFETASHLKELVKIQETEERKALEMLEKNEVAGIILLPAGFMDSIYTGENKPFVFIGNKEKRAAANLMKHQLLSAANLISAGQSGIITAWRYAYWGGAGEDLLAKLEKQLTYSFTMNSLGRNRVFREETVSFLPKITAAEYFTASLLAVFASFLGFMGMKSLVYEKAPGLRDRLRASPLKMWQILLGKFTASFVLVLVQLVFILLLTSAFFKTYLGSPVVSILVLLAASSFAVAAWATFIAAVSSTVQIADLLGYLGTPLLAIIGGNIYPLIALPDTIKRVSDFTFNKWMASGFTKIFAADPTLSLTPDVWHLMMIGSVLLIISLGILAWPRRK